MVIPVVAAPPIAVNPVFPVTNTGGIPICCEAVPAMRLGDKAARVAWAVFGAARDVVFPWTTVGSCVIMVWGLWEREEVGRVGEVTGMVEEVGEGMNCSWLVSG